MKDKMIFLENKGKKYPMVFNLNVMEEIQEEYGSLQAWGDMVSNEQGEPKIKDLKIGLAFMINEGIDILNEDKEVKEPLLTLKQVGRLLSEVGLQEAVEQIRNITEQSTDVGEERKNT